MCRWCRDGFAARRAADAHLRDQLICDVQARAEAWRRQGWQEPSDVRARLCQARASVLEQLVQDLEERKDLATA